MQTPLTCVINRDLLKTINKGDKIYWSRLSLTKFNLLLGSSGDSIFMSSAYYLVIETQTFIIVALLEELASTLFSLLFTF